MTQEPQPPYPQQPSAPGAWGEQGGQPVVPPAPHLPAVPAYHPAPVAPGYYGYPHQPPQLPSSSGLYVAAAVLNWVTLGLIIVATCGIGIIAAAWFIPMTIFVHKGARDRQKHTALAVCTLLFCNIIAGILMLVEDSNRPAYAVG